MIDKLQLALDLFSAGDLENARKIVEGYRKELPTMELISREEVLNILNDICNHALEVYDKKYHLPIRTITSTATEDIKRLPSRPKGKWIDGGRYSIHICSICKEEAECLQAGGGVEFLSDFCPYCGADMRGKQDG